MDSPPATKISSCPQALQKLIAASSDGHIFTPFDKLRDPAFNVVPDSKYVVPEPKYVVPEPVEGAPIDLLTTTSVQ